MDGRRGSGREEERPLLPCIFLPPYPFPVCTCNAGYDAMHNEAFNKSLTIFIFCHGPPQVMLFLNDVSFISLQFPFLLFMLQHMILQSRV